ncbi:MAG: hypothetical protein HRT71_02095 [Flavobacteriales bacterium]|nr:hypothetical protein [Flavobacteriales bacterium]
MDKKQSQEIKRNVIDAISSFYIDNSFKLKKATSEFKKNGFSIFWGESSKGVDSIVFRPQIMLENKEISDVLSSVFPNSVVNDTIIRVQGLSFAEEFGFSNFESSFVNDHGADGKSYYYRVEIDTDIEPIVSDHIRFMELIGLPFIEKISSLEGVHEYINERLLSVDDASLKTEEKQQELKRFFSKTEVLSSVVTSYILKGRDTNLLLERIKFLFEGNDYVLDDVQKVEEYFANPS